MDCSLIILRFIYFDIVVEMILLQVICFVLCRSIRYMIKNIIQNGILLLSVYSYVVLLCHLLLHDSSIIHALQTIWQQLNDMYINQRFLFIAPLLSLDKVERWRNIKIILKQYTMHFSWVQFLLILFLWIIVGKLGCVYMFSTAKNLGFLQ